MPRPYPRYKPALYYEGFLESSPQQQLSLSPGRQS